MIIYYDNRFNLNELVIIFTLIAAYTVVFLLPRRFPILITIIFILYGITSGHFTDHTISIQPMDYYDVNDTSYYEVYDLLSYLMYGPFSYFTVYFFDKYKLKKQHIILYVIAWGILSLSFEWVGVMIGLFHYDKGWKLPFSFPIYLFFDSILMFLYYKLCRQDDRKQHAK